MRGENEEDTGEEILDPVEEGEDNPLLDALRVDDPEAKKDEDGDEEAELAELEAKDGDSVDVLKIKLAAKNRIIRQRTASNKRMKKELEEKQAGKPAGLTVEDAVLLLQSQNRTADDGKTAEVKRAEQIAALKQRFEDDPSAIVELMLEREGVLEQKLADVLTRRDRHYESLLQTQRETKEIPADVQKLVDVLKQRPEYKGWEDDKLVTVARSFLPIASRMRGGRPPAGNGSGASRLPLTADSKAVQKVHQSALDAMGYGEDE